MPIKEQDLRDALMNAFPDAEIVLNDLAGDDDHWQAFITSAAFNGVTRIGQHRMVQKALDGHDIHALSMTTIAKEDK